MCHPHLLLLFLYLVSCIILVNGSEIIQVFIISRHCDRTPVSDIQLPLNPVNWKEMFGLDVGQLTGLGVYQCSEIGRALKDRYLNPNSTYYISGITQDYDSDFFQFYSTSSDRTIISLNSIAQGLFPSGTGMNNDITGQPALLDQITLIPVHISGASDDVVLKEMDLCPTIDSNVKDFYNSDEYSQMQSKYKPFINHVANVTGYAIPTLADYPKVYDVLFALKSHNLLHLEPILDDWNSIKSLGDLLQYSRYNRKILSRMGAGVLIDTIVDQMTKTISSNFTKPKYMHYSAHDTTLQSIIAALNLDSKYPVLRDIPPYGSQLVIELHKDHDEYFVQLIIRLGNEYNTEFTTYKLPKPCNKTMCPWKQFLQYVNENSRLPIDLWCYHCSNDYSASCMNALLRKSRIENVILAILTPTSSAVTIMLMICTIVSCRYSGNGKRNKYIKI
jgi:hypothetical protein